MPLTHAEQEQQLLDYFATYRDAINLKQFALDAEVPLGSLKFFLNGERPLSAQNVAKCGAYLKAQALALQVFLAY